MAVLPGVMPPPIPNPTTEPPTHESPDPPQRFATSQAMQEEYPALPLRVYTLYTTMLKPDRATK